MNESILDDNKKCEKCSIKDSENNCILSTYKPCNCDKPEPHPDLLQDSNLKVCKNCGHYIVRKGLNLYEHHNRCYDFCIIPYTSKNCMAKSNEPSMINIIKEKEKKLKKEEKTNAGNSGENK